jgi:hypothetical protein
LKPMLECAINAEVFPTITKKKKNSDISPKSRMTLFQGAENDISISNATIRISVSNATTIDAGDASKNHCKGSDILSINFAKSDANQFGSIVAEITDEANIVADTKNTIGAVVCKNEAPTHMSKLRIAFLEEGEDDEPMDHQIIIATYSENKHDPISISKGDVLKNCSIHFGSFSNVVTQQKNIIEVRSASQAMPGKVSIRANINKEERNRPYFKIGSMLVMLEESMDGIDIIHGFPRMWSTFH